MPEPRDFYTIAQFSDIHCGDSRFDTDLMEATIHEINDLKPDLVIVAGDLTADGYREQFDEAHSWIRQLNCEQKLVIAGNHDCRNVGYLHFEQLFGDRHYHTEELDFRICCVPSTAGIEEKLVIAGNHDCRNVGYLHFEQLFGDRHYHTEELDFRICCVPSTAGIQEK